jgi:hypothetical protein
VTDLGIPRVQRSVPDWHELGNCRMFPELDFVEAKPGTAEALACRALCAACPVALECATGALERRERWGIWGGLDYADRKAVAAEFGYEQPGDPPEHGTNSRRVKWGCTCPDCKAGHALYEAERRANARRAALRRNVWNSPLLVLTVPIRYRRVWIGAGQLLLPLPGLPAPAHTAPDEPALPTAA